MKIIGTIIVINWPYKFMVDRFSMQLNRQKV